MNKRQELLEAIDECGEIVVLLIAEEISLEKIGTDVIEPGTPER